MKDDNKSDFIYNYSELELYFKRKYDRQIIR